MCGEWDLLTGLSPYFSSILFESFGWRTGEETRSRCQVGSLEMT